MGKITEIGRKISAVLVAKGCTSKESAQWNYFAGYGDWIVFNCPLDSTIVSNMNYAESEADAHKTFRLSTGNNMSFEDFADYFLKN